MNHFQLLELEQSYDLTPAILKKQYLSMLAKFHPDRAPAGKNAEYVAKSMLINEAYKTLLDPYERAKYMLEQQGYSINEGTTNSSDKLNLVEIMEEYDWVEECANPAELQKFEQEKKQQQQGLIGEISTAFANNNFAQALDYSLRLKYLSNLIKYIKEKTK